MRNPLLEVVFAYAIGIALGTRFKVPEIYVIASLPVTLPLLFLVRRRSEPVFRAITIICAATLGVVALAVTSPQPLESLPGRLDFVLRLRTALASVQERTLPPGHAELVNSMVFGLGSRSLSGLNNYRISGTAHVFSVSGLHVGFVVLVCLAVSQALRLKPVPKAVFSGLAVWLYALIAGGRPSVLRASMMASFGLAGSVLGRKPNIEASIALAALLILLVNPVTLFDIGFQMSFVTTMAITNLFPIMSHVMSRCLRRLPAWLSQPVSLSLAAQAGISPLLARYFGTISLIAPLANLVIVPLAGAVVITGLIAGVVGLVLPWAAQVLNAGNSLLIDAMNLLAGVFASLPFADIPVRPPAGWFLVAYYALLYLGARPGVIKFIELRLVSRRTRMKVALAGLTAVLVLVWIPAFEVYKEDLIVTFISVGEGDSILVEAPSGRVALIDGGECADHLRTFESPQAVSVPSFLHRRGIRRIDLMILTHPHEDHLSGLIPVIRGFRVDTVLDAGQDFPSPLYEKFLDMVRQKNIPYVVARRGQVINLGKDTFLYVLHPSQEFLRTHIFPDPNESSVVVRIVYHKVSFLLAADIGAEGEAELVSEFGGSLRSTVLKVPHHGSKFSAWDKFFQAVYPKVAVISTGSNSFGHPGSETLSLLARIRSIVYRTDRQGTVTMRTDGRKVWVSGPPRRAVVRHIRIPGVIRRPLAGF